MVLTRSATSSARGAPTSHQPFELTPTVRPEPVEGWTEPASRQALVCGDPTPTAPTSRQPFVLRVSKDERSLPYAKLRHASPSVRGDCVASRRSNLGSLQCTTPRVSRITLPSSFPCRASGRGLSPGLLFIYFLIRDFAHRSPSLGSRKGPGDWSTPRPPQYKTRAV